MPLSEAIARLLSRFASSENIVELEGAILARDRDRTVTLAREIWASVMPTLQETYGRDLTVKAERAYTAAWNKLPGEGYPAPAGAIERALRQSAARVTNMTSQSRLVINRLVTAAIAGGASNPRLASTLVATGLGMNGPQARAHVRMAKPLFKAVADGKMTQERALSRLEADRRKKIRFRAVTISRTETSDTRGYARQRAWSDAARSGKIKAREWEKVWRTAQDDFVDEVCVPLDGATASVNGRFFTGDLRPPKHPRCRCTCTLRRKKG